jgi:YD repeat-containing protein
MIPDGCTDVSTPETGTAWECGDAHVSGALIQGLARTARDGDVQVAGTRGQVKTVEMQLDGAVRSVTATNTGNKLVAYAWTEEGALVCVTSAADPRSRCEALMDAFARTVPRLDAGNALAVVSGGHVDCPRDATHAIACPDGSWSDRGFPDQPITDVRGALDLAATAFRLDPSAWTQDFPSCTVVGLAASCVRVVADGRTSFAAIGELEGRPFVILCGGAEHGHGEIPKACSPEVGL